MRATSTTDGNVTATGTIHVQRGAHLQSRHRWRRRHTATTDGLLILRNLLQLSGNALINGAYNPAMAPTAI